MRARRIWIVIAVILITGVCSTTYTKHYVEEREISTAMRITTETTDDTYAAAAETEAGAAPAAMPFAVEAAPEAADEEIPAAPGSTADSSVMTDETEVEAEEAGAPKTLTDGAADRADSGIARAMAREEGIPAADGETGPAAPSEGAAIPDGTAPATGSAGAGGATTAGAGVPQETGAMQHAPLQAPGQPAGAAPAETVTESRTDVIVAGSGKDKVAISYKTRLEELDVQIARNRAADAEKSVGYSVKARAEAELKLWEAELAAILKALEERLDAETVEKLYTQQREWQREKEAKALEAAKRQSGSTLEEVEYSVSLAESTRARAYELVMEYEAVLE